GRRRRARARPARGAGGGAGTRRRPRPGFRGSAADVRTRGLPRGLDARDRRRDRRARDAAGARVHDLAGLPQAEGPATRPRAAFELPRGRVRRRDLHGEPCTGRGLAADGLRAQQRSSRTEAELHDHLESLRASRLPRAPEHRRAPRAQDVRGRDVDRAADAALGIQLPVSRRRLRHRGQPHRRPARPGARPLHVRDRPRPSRARSAVLRQQGRRHRRQRPDLQICAPLPGRARRRPGSVAVPDPASAPRATGDARYERLMYPIDWIEERSGLIGGLRYFLFRKVPGDTDWFQTLGSATLTAFLVQAVTGTILAMYYKPDPKNAYPSIVRIS